MSQGALRDQGKGSSGTVRKIYISPVKVNLHEFILLIEKEIFVLACFLHISGRERFIDCFLEQRGGFMKTFRSLLIAVGFTAAAGLSVSAYANPTLTLTLDDLSIPGIEVTVGPQATPPNFISYSGPVGTVWDINVSTGLISGPESIDLNSVNHSTAAGDLQITFTATGIDAGTGAGLLGFLDAIGGTQQPAGSTITWAAYVNGVLGTTGSSGSNPFSGSSGFSAMIADLSNFSMQLVVTIHHTGAGTTSFDNELTHVPEPGSLLLLGAGLIGLAAIRRRKTTV